MKSVAYQNLLLQPQHWRRAASLLLAGSLMAFVAGCADVINEPPKNAAALQIAGKEEGAGMSLKADGVNYNAAVTLIKNHYEKSAKWQAGMEFYAEPIDRHPALMADKISSEVYAGVKPVPADASMNEILIGITNSAGDPESTRATFLALKEVMRADKTSRDNVLAQKEEVLQEDEHITITLQRNPDSTAAFYRAKDVSNERSKEGDEWPENGALQGDRALMQTGGLKPMAALSTDAKADALYLPSDPVTEATDKGSWGTLQDWTTKDGIHLVWDAGKAPASKPDGHEVIVRLDILDREGKATGAGLQWTVIDDGDFVITPAMLQKADNKGNVTPLIAEGEKKPVRVAIISRNAYLVGGGMTLLEIREIRRGYLEHPKKEEKK